MLRSFAILLLIPATAVVAQTQPTTRPVESITLRTGERIIGTIVERSDAGVVIESRALGRLTIASDEIDVPATRPADVVTSGTSAAEITPVSPLSAAPPPTPGDRGLFGTGVLVDWSRQFEFGFSGSSGTTDSLSLNTQANASYASDRYRSTLGASYFLDRNDGVVGRNQTRVFATADDRIDGGPYFVFGRAQYDNDSLQEWENRVSVFGGPGYEFVKNAKYELLGRVGVGYTTEFGGSVPGSYDENRIEALVGVDGKWTIDPTSSLVASVYYTPSVEHFGDEGRVVTTIAYQADFASYRGLGFKTGIEHDYEFRTAGDDEHANVKYFANLVYKL